MSPVVSSEEDNHSGRYTCKTNINFGKSVKVDGKSKQIALMQNTDGRERQNLYHVIDIGCIFNKIAKKKSIDDRAQLFHFKYSCFH